MWSPRLTLELSSRLGSALHSQVGQVGLQQHVLAVPIEGEIGTIEGDKVWVSKGRS